MPTRVPPVMAMAASSSPEEMMKDASSKNSGTASNDTEDTKSEKLIMTVTKDDCDDVL